MHRIAVAFKSALLTAILAFLVAFVAPLVIGGPGAHQAPLAAFFITPIIFVMTLALTLLWPRLVIVTIVASLLYPAWYYHKMPPRQPDHVLAALNHEERAVVQSRHFDLRVAVDGGRFPEVYRRGLVSDLGQTGLFTEIGRIEEIHLPDLIATVTGSHYGDQEGHRFSLHWTRHPERKVTVDVWHYATMFPLSYARRHHMENERLALEVIRQMDALGAADQATSPAIP